MNNSLRGTYTVGLFEVNAEIGYNNSDARNFLDFLFADLPCCDLPLSTRRFDLLFVGRPARMSLWLGDKQLYFGESRYALAYLLINEIIYDCIINNSNELAVHAAAFSIGDRGIIFPGKSGSGKSSIAAWLTVKGFTFLTDELVLLSREGRMRPFTRPLSLKPAAFAALKTHAPCREEEMLVGEKGSMIPHRCLNPHWSRTSPGLATIIFPEFIAGHPATLTRLSSAQSCLKLMGCYVNARNIPGHGFSDLAHLARKAASFDLKFGGFDDILTTLQPILCDGQ